MPFKTDLKKYAERGKYYGKNHFDWISRCKRHEASFAFIGVTCTSVGTINLFIHALANSL
jgi:hypothetical protein